MGTMYWVRVGMMILTFVFVVMAIRNLKNPNPTVPPIAKMILGSGDEQKIVLCPTRVTWLETTAGLRVEESGMKWTRTSGGEKVELDPIAVEKWFGRNCAVIGRATDTEQGFEPILKLGLVNGESKVLARSGSGTYLWERVKFVSSSLDQALRELSELPAHTPAGHK